MSETAGGKKSYRCSVMVVHAQGLWYRSVCLSVTTLAATFLVHTLQGAIRPLVAILTN